MLLPSFRTSESNPMGNVRDCLRGNTFGPAVWDGYKAIVDTRTAPWLLPANDLDRIRSIVQWDWAVVNL